MRWGLDNSDVCDLGTIDAAGGHSTAIGGEVDWTRSVMSSL